MITPLNQRPNYQANTLNKNSDARVENENKEVKTKLSNIFSVSSEIKNGKIESWK